MNVPLLVADHALAQAEELEAEAQSLLDKARDKFTKAAVCRMLAASAGPREPEPESIGGGMVSPVAAPK